MGAPATNSIQGGGGNDIIDGDAWLHVSLSKQSAGAQILRQILFDANGNTWDPQAIRNNNGTFTGAFTGVGQNAANVDTAVYRDVFANYSISGKDAEGFITVKQNAVSAGAANDDTDRIRHIERLQFKDVTVSIDADGKILTSSDGKIVDTDPISRAHYDAVPVGTPTLSENDPTGAIVDPAAAVNVGNTLTANVAAITDADNATRLNPTGAIPGVTYQWQFQNALRLAWIDIAGATSSTFTPTTFQQGTPLRVEASYVDAKGYKETVISAPTAVVTLPGNVNTAPFVVPALQFNGISNTSSVLNAPFDYFAPLTSIFADAQTASNALLYSATLADGSSLASIGMTFTFNPVTGSGEFAAPLGFNSTGQIGVRVKATDTGPGVPLSVTNTFFINVVPLNSPPVAVNDSYTAFKNTTLTVLPNGVMANDFDPNGDTFTAQLVTGPAHGTLNFKADGSFTYLANPLFVGADSFTYHDTDIASGISNNATVSINVLQLRHSRRPRLLRRRRIRRLKAPPSGARCWRERIPTGRCH